MAKLRSKSVRLCWADQRSVSALLLVPPAAKAVFVFAHGAGAGMTHPFMENGALLLAGQGIATLRFQFPYMEAGSRRPDSPKFAHAVIRAAVATAQQRFPKLPVFAGGKSFGGRMTSQAQALEALVGVTGLIFLGFPLHPPKKPAIERAEHLLSVTVPMLFVQGTRDDLASPPLLKKVLRKLGKLATHHPIPDADHAFHVPARAGKSDAVVLQAAVERIAAWIGALSAAYSGGTPRAARAAK